MAPALDFLAPPTQAGMPYVAHGDVASILLANNGDVGYLRPFRSDNPDDPRSFMTVNSGKRDKLGRPIPQTILTNNPASLRFQDWRLIDEAVVRVAKPRLAAVADLRGGGLEVSLANGMAFTQFSYENQSDVSAATISMDGLRRGENDRPVYNIVNLPLPVIHKDFSFPMRQVMASRNGNSPLDTTTAELAARRVAESAENLLLGVQASYAYGGGTVYGYTNFPNRLTYTMTNPNHPGWTPHTAVQEVLAMQVQSRLAFHYGPWMLYCSPNWDAFLDEDYSSAKGDNTLRERLERIKGIIECKTIDYLQFLPSSPYVMLLVQMQPETVREVVGLDITTMQWESHGGMMMNFKVMCIMVPQLRADQNNNSGIVHGQAPAS